MDSDGHFMAAHPTDRKAVHNLLKNIHDGDYYADMVHNEGIEFKDNLSEHCCKEWDEIIDEFIQRGTLEYVDIPDRIPDGCKCE